jgi:hypothetical protein
MKDAILDAKDAKKGLKWADIAKAAGISAGVRLLGLPGHEPS